MNFKSKLKKGNPNGASKSNKKTNNQQSDNDIVTVNTPIDNSDVEELPPLRKAVKEEFLFRFDNCRFTN